jgi:hypothetical protein
MNADVSCFLTGKGSMETTRKISPTPSPSRWYIFQKVHVDIPQHHATDPLLVPLCCIAEETHIHHFLVYCRKKAGSVSKERIVLIPSGEGDEVLRAISVRRHAGFELLPKKPAERPHCDSGVGESDGVQYEWWSYQVGDEAQVATRTH